MPRIYLHIGTPKSGTTYLQSKLARNHGRAAAQGLLWPGPSRSLHVAAGHELRRLTPGERPAPTGPWSRLLEEAASWQGHAVLISMESLVELVPHQIEAVLASVEPMPVDVVCTARDLLRTFAGQGQEMAKNYRTWPWSQLVSEVLGDTGGPAHQRFWRQQDVPTILRRWLDVLPADRVHLVTLPPAGGDPGLLWHRFCGMLGVNGSGFRAPRRDNPSFGAVSTALMQRLNTVAARRGLGHRTYMRAVHKTIGLDTLGPRRRQEERIGLSDEMDAFLRERSLRMVEELRGLGLDLHGEWSDLVPTAPLTGRGPEAVSDSELLDVALEALVDLAVRTAAEERSGVPPVEPRGVAEQGRRAVRAARRAVDRARGGGD